MTEVKLSIQHVVMNYIRKHRELFGIYEGELMNRPSKEVLKQTNMTFFEYLKKIDAEVLEALFMCTQTAQGYGHIDEIPALYGLLWMTPNFLNLILKPDDPGEKDVHILDKGFQFLWEEIARQENLNVQLNHKVSRIIRNPNRKSVDLVVYQTDCGVNHQHSFDFLILSPSMKQVKNYMHFEGNESKIFEKLKENYYTTTLVDHEFSNARSESPQNYYIFNMESKIESNVWVSRDSFASLQYIQGDKFKNTIFPDGKDNKTLQTSVIYQFSKNSPNETELDRHLTNYFEQTMNTYTVNTQTDIVARETWPYFPKFSASDLTSGVLWDILEMQGKFNTWYIGSSVSFESVKSVVEYNILLMRLFEETNNKKNIESDLNKY